jgi:hypothetical protein
LDILAGLIETSLEMGGRRQLGDDGINMWLKNDVRHTISYLLLEP